MAFKPKATDTSGILSKRYLWLSEDSGQNVRVWRYITADDASTIAASGYITDEEYLDLMEVGDIIWATEVGSISDSRTIQEDEATGGFVAYSVHRVDSNDGTTIDLTGDLLGGTPADNSITLAMLQSATAGDILYWDASGDPALLSIGTPGQALVVSGSNLPSYGSVAGSGTMTTVKEAGVQVGDADIATLDFDGDDFNLSESPDTEINITINKSGSDTTIVSGTAGTNGNLVSWNGDGDAVDSGLAPTGSDSGAVTGTAGTSGNLVSWDANGDAVDSGLAPSGSDASAITGTAGTSGNLASWDANGDLVDAGLSTSGLTGQIVVATSTTESDVTTTIPLDDTIPQITEGDEIVTVSITPTNASSTILIEGIYSFGLSSNGIFVSAAVFIDATAGAIGAVTQEGDSNVLAHTVPFTFTHSPGDTSAHTYRLRVGPSSGTAHVNQGASGASLFSTAGPICTIKVTEILP